MIQKYRAAVTSLIAALMCALFCLQPLAALGEVEITIIDPYGDEVSIPGMDEPGDTADASDPAEEGDASDAVEGGAVVDPTARDAFIDGIIDLAKQLYDKANGRPQRAQYSGDIYVCKNFTVHLFRENRERFRMAEYPDTKLVIPNNKPKKECKEYVYGVEWEDVSAAEGNPFEVAASFRYDDSLTKEENWELAREFLKQVKRGDYFQMAAKYYYGVGAHSMIFIADYDSETDSVHWCDSNMRGATRNNERYGYVQFDEVKEIDWFVDAFCRKKHGATLYRLRDDIVFAE